ncbi:MAG: ABC transporter permease [Actinomycetota bacterium]|jgi:oligopeptide transport system permease protein|nr:ABC transporter permease [Actinomycetota bacterium]MDA2948842.1 ABC transporter permease [Actinomycetota bacterium]MDA2991169.1 ABC transporter permease [Actinomycetota bacterium]
MADDLDAHLDAEGAELEPLVGQSSVWGNAWKYLRTNPLFLIGLTVLVVMLAMALFPALFARGVDPTDCDLSLSRQRPSAQHWFGMDLQGCDYYANVVYGARTSVAIGVLTVIGVLIIGVLIGALAGYYGGWADSVLARLTDVFFGIPLFLGALILLTVSPQRSVWTVSLALIVFGWMTAMRLVRSSVVSIREADYVLAAQALGASSGRILLRHILPNALAPVLIYATIAVGTFISAESALTYLGIGLQAPEISWGLQINVAQSLIGSSPHLLFFPALFLSVTVLGFILLGDALRDALDPKRR